MVEEMNPRIWLCTPLEEHHLLPCPASEIKQKKEAVTFFFQFNWALDPEKVEIDDVVSTFFPNLNGRYFNLY